MISIFTLYTLFPPFLPLKVIDLKTQLNNFKKVEKLLRSTLGEAQGKRVISRAVYLFHIGVNDYQYPFSTNSSVFQSNPHETYVDFVVGNTTAVIKVNHKLIWLDSLVDKVDDQLM